MPIHPQSRFFFGLTFINRQEDLNFIVNIPPLYLRNAHFIPDHFHRYAFGVILYEAGPAAHGEGQMFRQAGIRADIFQQIFQTARRPGEDLIGLPLQGLILENYYRGLKENGN